jgi:putative transposase
VKLCEERVAEYNATPHRGLPKFQDPQTGRFRHMSPDECWEAHVANDFEPVEISQDEVDDLFRPYAERVVRRGTVDWHTNSYFDHALRTYHGEKVMVGYDYHQADKVWVREFDVATGQPGPLICVAAFMANAQRYVPRSFQQESEERRAEGQIKRKQDKIRAIEAERDGLGILEHQAAEVFDLFAQTEPEPERVPVHEAPAQAASGSLRFASDEHLAAWALDHPNELTEDQIGVLRDCISRSTARELFRMSGIDTEALRTLLRAVA